jgi:two-component system, OmpR family, response regulator ChvI
MRILIVDDENDIILSLQKGLTRKGFEVDVYTDSQKALDNFKPNMYDLSLVDVKMPDMDGFELYRQMKKKDSNAKICFMTAFDMHYNEFKKMFPSIDIKCFIRKPISLKDLISHIQSEMQLV